MNKTAVELKDQQGLSVELINTTVADINTGWQRIAGHKFTSNQIHVIKFSNYNNNLLNMFYFSDDVEKHCIVPPDFMFNLIDNEKAKELVAKYQDHMIRNISQSLGFTGSAIGSDPEIFVENKRGGLIPAFKFLGSKEKPNTCQGYGEGYSPTTPSYESSSNTLYWDGFQAEFTTKASHCMGWHGDSIQAGLRGLYEAARKYDKKAKLSIKTVFDIPYEMLIESAPEHVAFGCMRSFNAYGLKGLEAPGYEVMYRTAGGHIHLGFSSKQSEADCIKMVKGMDAILAVTCVSMFEKYDDPRRREMYGLAGEYRLPPHGLEYRVLSNAWLFHPVIANIVFDLARSAAMFGVKNLMQSWQCDEAETIRIINTCDVKAAREVLGRNKDLLIQIINARYRNIKCAEYVYNTIINGMDWAVEDVSDLVKNWNLDKEWKNHCDGEGKNVEKTINLGKKV